MNCVEKAESLEVGDKVVVHTEMDATLTGEVEKVEFEQNSYRDIFLMTDSGRKGGIAVQYQNNSVYASQKNPRTGSWNGIGQVTELNEK